MDHVIFFIHWSWNVLFVLTLIFSNNFLHWYWAMWEICVLQYRWFRSRPSGSSHSCRPMQTLLWALQKPLPSQPVLARPEHFSIVLTHYKARYSRLTPWPAHQTSPCRHCPGRCCRAPVPGWEIGRRGSYHPAPHACDAIMELVRCVWHLSYFATGLLLENCTAEKILCF